MEWLTGVCEQTLELRTTVVRVVGSRERFNNNRRKSQNKAETPTVLTVEAGEGEGVRVSVRGMGRLLVSLPWRRGSTQDRVYYRRRRQTGAWLPSLLPRSTGERVKGEWRISANEKQRCIYLYLAQTSVSEKKSHFRFSEHAPGWRAKRQEEEGDKARRLH